MKGIIIFQFVALQVGWTQEASKFSTSTKEVVSIHKRYAEVATEINQQPDIAALKEKRDSAQAAYQEAFDAAFKKRDSALFDEMQTLRERRMKPVMQREATHAGKSSYDALTTEEQKKLLEARQAVANDPAVKEARSLRNRAATEEERQAAEEEYKRVLNEAILRADPELKGVIEKMSGKPVEDTGSTEGR